MKSISILLLMAYCLQNFSLKSQEIREFIDLQTHPTMHMLFGFFSEGLQYFEDGDEPDLTYKHQFKNVNYANYLKQNKGARIIVTGALTKDNIKRPNEARSIILQQIKFINDFAQDNSEHFVVAKSPDEVRELLKTTDKTIFIHSIEGAKKLINSQDDANFWAAQGVAFITLVHLVDSDLGSAAIRPGLATHLINFKGTMKSNKKRGGLTDKGKNVILWLANAGIMTDVTHMSDQSRIDALEFMETHNIPPISTHDLYKPIQNHPRGMTSDQILKIYQNNGFISLPISGITMQAHKPDPYFRDKIKQLDHYCNGSIDSYKFTYNAVKELIESNYKSINPEWGDVTDFSALEENEKVDLSIGFQSDFNGWLNHSKPRYGKNGCYQLAEDVTYDEIELVGLAHPGLLLQHWQLLEKEGVDLSPLKRNAEKFIQLWEQFLNKSGTFEIEILNYSF